MNLTELSNRVEPSLSRDTDTVLLRIENVTKNYVAGGETVHALNGVSLNIHSGEFLALVGWSGCGKSTLLSLAGAMDFPSSGQVWLDGVKISEFDDTGLTRLRREKVGFIFQSFQLLNTLTVLEKMTGSSRPVTVGFE